METTFWRKCATCKKEIGFNSIYQVCSVSSCSKHVYCSVNCWDQHNPIMNHKTSWAEERRSPRAETAVGTLTEGQRRVIVTPKPALEEEKRSENSEHEILIVASKLKAYVKDKYDLNTAASVMDALSDQVRRLTDRAVEKARAEGRKTLMDRDFHS